MYFLLYMISYGFETNTIVLINVVRFLIINCI